MKKHIVYTFTLLCFFALVEVSWAQEELQTNREPLTVHPFDAKKTFHQSEAHDSYPYRKIDGRASGEPAIQQVFSPLSGKNLYANGVLDKKWKDPKSHVPVFIKTYHPVQHTSTGQLFKSKNQVRKITNDYLQHIDHFLALKNPVDELQIDQIRDDKEGHTHVNLHQHYRGIPIHGGELKVHYSPNGTRIVNGHHFPTPKLRSLSPRLSSEEALAIAHEDIQRREKPVNLLLEGANEWGKASPSTAELVLYPSPGKKGKFHLAYSIDFHPSLTSHWAYMVDAQTGEVLDAYSQACSFIQNFGQEFAMEAHAPFASFNPREKQARDLNGKNQSFQTYEAQGQNGQAFLMIDASKRMHKGLSPGKAFPEFGGETGSIFTMDLRNQALKQDATFSYVVSENDQWDPIAVSAHTNSDICYDYYEQVHGRNSINDGGMDIVSFINVANEDGSSMGNAFWVDRFMFYGNGDRAFGPFAGALDVGGHEMTHGVIASSANLEYKNASGALNESFADIFGIMVDREDYKLAEDIVNPDIFPSGAMRDLANPHNGASPGDPRWQPSHMDEYVETTQDNGGVHINSGIPNHAAYRIIESIGHEKTERIYYRALTEYLTRSSNFLDCRFAVVQSAKDLFGDQSQEALACAQGFAAVGIGEPVPDNDTPTDPETKTPPLEVNPGSQFIMFTNTDPFCDCPLQRVDLEDQSIETISKTHHIRPVSVSDDGTLAIMITDNREVSLIDLSGDSPFEEVVETGEVTWGNVVLSKDGKRFAAVTDQAEGSIFIADLVSGEIVQFELYNPTTGQGITQSDMVLFADALEWDHSGQFLFYDALNSVGASSSRESDEYWDIGILHAWDNERNTFGSGQITKIFTNLPPGFDIGNPSLAKNSTHILTYEIVNFSENEYQILSTNLETGDTKMIWENVRLGFPEYSVTDNQLIFSAENTSGEPVLATIDLQADKITPIAGTETGIIGNAKWPIWYATGTRSLVPLSTELPTSNAKKLADASTVYVYPNPLASSSQLFIESQSTGLIPNSLRITDLMGKEVGTWTFTPSSLIQKIQLPTLPIGMYLAEIQTGEESFYQRIQIQ